MTTTTATAEMASGPQGNGAGPSRQAARTCWYSGLRWSPKIGQVVKLGSPFEKDEPDDGETATVWRGFQGESGS